jgi:hypothetical protein
LKNSGREKRAIKKIFFNTNLQLEFNGRRKRDAFRRLLKSFTGEKLVCGFALSENKKVPRQSYRNKCCLFCK